MKKIISLLLIMICVLSLVACNVPEEEKGFNVHFETNGGQEMEDVKTLRLEEEPHAAYKGHVFEGWYLDAEFTTPAQFPMDVTGDMTLYAKWLKIAHTESIPDKSLKLALGHDATMAHNVTPTGLDLELLQSLGYDTVVVEVDYAVSYEKDYSLPFGYLGAPKYGAVLLCSDFDTEFDKDFGLEADTFVEATITPSAKTISYTIKMSDIGAKKIMLVFSTMNIQNIVHFKNINVTYTAEKSVGN